MGTGNGHRVAYRFEQWLFGLSGALAAGIPWMQAHKVPGWVELPCIMLLGGIVAILGKRSNGAPKEEP